jgi:ligand-binding sensor domain-containing protein
MFEDGSAALWLALDPKNYSGPTDFSRFQQGRLINVIGSKHPLPGGVILKEVRGIKRAASGCSTSIKVFSVQPMARSQESQNALELEPNYRVLYADREGRIWVGQPGQVALYGHRKSQIFGTSDGVPPGRVWTIFHEHAGSIWVGGEGGPSKFDNDRFRTLSQSNGLPAESIFAMAEDDDGYWWIATDVEF